MQPHESGQVQNLFHQSFQERLHPYMVYGQIGLSSYLSDICLHPQVFPQFILTVAVNQQNDVIGFTEFRSTGSEGFLSNIFLDERSRGQGLGTQMIQHFLDNHPHIISLELDVLGSNPKARELYKRLGFKEVSQKYWQRRDITFAADDSESGPFVSISMGISNIAMHSRYGFSDLSVVCDGVQFTFGRLGERVLRYVASNSELLPPNHVLKEIQTHFPQINMLFTIAPEPIVSDFQIDVSTRMRWAL